MTTQNAIEKAICALKLDLPPEPTGFYTRSERRVVEKFAEYVSTAAYNAAIDRVIALLKESPQASGSLATVDGKYHAHTGAMKEHGEPADAQERRVESLPADGVSGFPLRRVDPQA